MASHPSEIDLGRLVELNAEIPLQETNNEERSLNVKIKHGTVDYFVNGKRYELGVVKSKVTLECMGCTVDDKSIYGEVYHGKYSIEEKYIESNELTDLDGKSASFGSKFNANFFLNKQNKSKETSLTVYQREGDLLPVRALLGGEWEIFSLKSGADSCLEGVFINNESLCYLHEFRDDFRATLSINAYWEDLKISVPGDGYIKKLLRNKTFLMNKVLGKAKGKQPIYKLAEKVIPSET